MEIKETGGPGNAENGSGEGAARNALFLRLARLAGASGAGAEAAALRPRVASRFETPLSARAEFDFAPEPGNEFEAPVVAEAESVPRARDAFRAPLRDSFAAPMSQRPDDATPAPISAEIPGTGNVAAPLARPAVMLRERPFTPTDSDQPRTGGRPEYGRATPPQRAQKSAPPADPPRLAPESKPSEARRAAASEAPAVRDASPLPRPARAVGRRNDESEISQMAEEAVRDANRERVSPPVRAEADDLGRIPTQAATPPPLVPKPQNPPPAATDQPNAASRRPALPERRTAHGDDRRERRGDLRPHRAENAALRASAAPPAAPAPIIQVTIGRIEVRAAPPSSVRAIPPTPVTAADDNLTHYLRRRDRQ